MVSLCCSAGAKSTAQAALGAPKPFALRHEAASHCAEVLSALHKKAHRRTWHLHTILQIDAHQPMCQAASGTATILCLAVFEVQALDHVPTLARIGSDRRWCCGRNTLTKSHRMFARYKSPVAAHKIQQ